jgi:hypothetical protein
MYGRPFEGHPHDESTASPKGGCARMTLFTAAGIVAGLLVGIFVGQAIIASDPNMYVGIHGGALWGAVVRLFWLAGGCLVGAVVGAVVAILTRKG